jgi:hypothetical protein
MKDNYNPYCPVCNACGEEGCCSALMCEQSLDGHYCRSYLNDLQFAYRMYKYFEHDILDKLSVDLQHEYNVEWNKTYDLTYNINNK